MERGQPTALDVAKFFLSIAEQEGDGDTISNLKMQKLVYYAQGYHLAITGKRLFDEDIQAWKHGTVVQNLYSRLNTFGNNAIVLGQLGDIDISVFTEEQKDILEDVYDTYGIYSASMLRYMTHNERPWKETTNGGEYIETYMVIPDDLIKGYFIEYLDKKYGWIAEQDRLYQEGKLETFDLKDVVAKLNV